MPERRRERVAAAQVELELLESGAGGEPLLVLHGFCGAKENFAEVMNPLADRGWHVVVPDQRGHGESSHPKRLDCYSFELFVSDALSLADCLGWERFALLGHSMGGMTAQLIALEQTDRLTALVLMDTTHTRFEIDPEMAAMGRQLVETGGMQAIVEATRGLDGPLVSDAHRRLLKERVGYEEMLEAQNLATSPDMWLAMSEAMFGATDRLEDLRQITIPTLVMVGEQDEPFLAPSRRMSEMIPGAHFETIPNAGHSPQLEAPEAWLNAVLSFLESQK